MRKIMTVWSLVLCISLTPCVLTGCTYIPEEIAFEKDWGFGVYLYQDGQMILDEKTAIKLATAYIEILVEDTELAADYTYSSSRYNADISAWLITFTPRVDSLAPPCHVCIGTDGKVQLAFGDEV